MGVGMGNETTWEEEVMEVGWVERGRKEGMGLSIAVRWDVGVTGMEGDGKGRVWEVGMACTCLEPEPDMEKPTHTPRTGPAQTHTIRGTGLTSTPPFFQIVVSQSRPCVWSPQLP